ncbi:unnamed protein product, partial [Amoebophrya sp. A120]
DALVVEALFFGSAREASYVYHARCRGGLGTDSEDGTINTSPSPRTNLCLSNAIFLNCLSRRYYLESEHAGRLVIDQMEKHDLARARLWIRQADYAEQRAVAGNPRSFASASTRHGVAWCVVDVFWPPDAGREETPETRLGAWGTWGQEDLFVKVTDGGVEKAINPMTGAAMLVEGQAQFENFPKIPRGWARSPLFQRLFSQPSDFVQCLVREVSVYGQRYFQIRNSRVRDLLFRPESTAGGDGLPENSSPRVYWRRPGTSELFELSRAEEVEDLAREVERSAPQLGKTRTVWTTLRDKFDFWVKQNPDERGTAAALAPAVLLAVKRERARGEPEPLIPSGVVSHPQAMFTLTEAGYLTPHRSDSTGLPKDYANLFGTVQAYQHAAQERGVGGEGRTISWRLLAQGNIVGGDLDQQALVRQLLRSGGRDVTGLDLNPQYVRDMVGRVREGKGITQMGISVEAQLSWEAHEVP